MSGFPSVEDGLGGYDQGNDRAKPHDPRWRKDFMRALDSDVELYRAYAWGDVENRLLIASVYYTLSRL